MMRRKSDDLLTAYWELVEDNFSLVATVVLGGGAAYLVIHVIAAAMPLK